MNEAIFRNKLTFILNSAIEAAQNMTDIFAIIVKSPIGQMYEIELAKGHAIRQTCASILA